MGFDHGGDHFAAGVLLGDDDRDVPGGVALGAPGGDDTGSPPFRLESFLGPVRDDEGAAGGEGELVGGADGEDAGGVAAGGQTGVDPDDRDRAASEETYVSDTNVCGLPEGGFDDVEQFAVEFLTLKGGPGVEGEQFPQVFGGQVRPVGERGRAVEGDPVDGGAGEADEFTDRLDAFRGGGGEHLGVGSEAGADADVIPGGGTGVVGAVVQRSQLVDPCPVRLGSA